MLLFRQRPDVVFCDIVREALAWIAEDLKANETDPHVMSTLLPLVAPVLSFETALATVAELRTALDSAAVYELEPVHRLILANALKRYCEAYNDQPQQTELHWRYEVHKLNCERLVGTFLGPLTLVGSATLSVCPGDVALQLYISADAPWRSPLPQNESPWHRSETEYPFVPQDQGDKGT
jgi:hypothetical protein